MNLTNEKRSKPFPKFDSLDALVEFVEENDLSEYVEQMPEVNFEINLKRRIWIMRQRKENHELTRTTRKRFDLFRVVSC